MFVRLYDLVTKWHVIVLPLLARVALRGVILAAPTLHSEDQLLPLFTLFTLLGLTSLLLLSLLYLYIVTRLLSTILSKENHF